MTGKLSDTALEWSLKSLAGWSHDAAAGTIRREFKFASFSEAFAFMTRVAMLCEKADHHPDWSNSYNRVSVTLSTHSAGGLTEKDVNLATAIDRLLAG
jgi:4a-hydroxytetrahydrobiopterin dehydratase